MYVLFSQYERSPIGCFLSLKKLKAEVRKYMKHKTTGEYLHVYRFNLNEIRYEYILRIEVTLNGKIKFIPYIKIREKDDPIRDFLSDALSGDGQALDAIRDIIKS